MRFAFEDVEFDGLEKAFGKRDLSKLHKVKITDKNGVSRYVWVKNEQKPVENRRGKAKENAPIGRRAKKGDRVSFMKDGRLLQGEVTGRGSLGVTVRGEGEAKGVAYHVRHKDVKAVRKLQNPNFIAQNGKFRGGDNGLQLKKADTIEGLYKTVEAARAEFSELSEGLVKRFAALNPRLMKRDKLKDAARIKEKLREDAKEAAKKKKDPSMIYDEKTDTYHCRSIRDCDGATMFLKSMDDVEKVAAYLNKQPYVIRMKNNFATPTDVGYSDININIRLSNGAIVELQLNTIPNIVAKGQYGHALYEIQRSIRDNPKYGRLEELVVDAQKALYGTANKYSQEGNFPTTSDIFSDKYKHEPYAAAIREQVKAALPLYRQAKEEGLFNKKTIEHFEKLVEFLR